MDRYPSGVLVNYWCQIGCVRDGRGGFDLWLSNVAIIKKPFELYRYYWGFMAYKLIF